MKRKKDSYRTANNDREVPTILGEPLVYWDEAEEILLLPKPSLLKRLWRTLTRRG